MPLRTNRMEERSSAVRYALKQYKAGKTRKAPETAAAGSADASKEKQADVKVVKIRRQPLKAAWQRIKEYFR